MPREARPMQQEEQASTELGNIRGKGVGRELWQRTGEAVDSWQKRRQRGREAVGAKQMSIS